MAGTESGVATQLKLLNRKCVFTHCYGHALELTFGGVIQNLKDVKEIFSTAYQIRKL